MLSCFYAASDYYVISLQAPLAAVPFLSVTPISACERSRQMELVTPPTHLFPRLPEVCVSHKIMFHVLKGLKVFASRSYSTESEVTESSWYDQRNCDGYDVQKEDERIYDLVDTYSSSHVCENSLRSTSFSFTACINHSDFRVPLTLTSSTAWCLLKDPIWRPVGRTTGLISHAFLNVKNSTITWHVVCIRFNSAR